MAALQTSFLSAPPSAETGSGGPAALQIPVLPSGNHGEATYATQFEVRTKFINDIINDTLTGRILRPRTPYFFNFRMEFRQLYPMRSSRMARPTRAAAHPISKHPRIRGLTIPWPPASFSFLVWLAYFASIAPAQTMSTVISGFVRDQSGAVLAGVQVDLLGTDGNLEQSTMTNTSGAFRFSKVEPGNYGVQFQRESFKPARIRLKVGTRSPAPLNIVMEIAGLRQQLTVSD